MEKTFIAIGPNCWGKDTQRTVALKNAHRNLPSFIRDQLAPRIALYRLFEVSGETYVTDMGGMGWDEGNPRPKYLGSFDKVFRLVEDPDYVED